MENWLFLNHLWYIFVRLKYVIYLQLIILRLWNFFSYSWKPIVYYNFWKLILHLITLHIYCLIELIRILVTYWVVNSLLFPLQFQNVKNTKFWEFWCYVVSRKRSLGILGLDDLLIVLYLLANWHYVHEDWILFLLNCWHYVHEDLILIF